MTTDKDTQRAANSDRLQAIAADIAAGLGLTIKVPHADDLPTRDSVHMEGPAGERVSLWVNRFGAKFAGKVEVCGATWRVNEGGKAYVPQSVEAPAICVSLSKSTAQILRDIKNRFWGPYLEVLATHRAARAEYDANRSHEAWRAGLLGSIVGAPVVFEGERAVSLNLYRSADLPEELADLSIKSVGVRFDRLDVSDDVAIEILQILRREYKRTPKAE